MAAVSDAAWTLSAGGDAARLDALTGAQVPEDISRQRWALDQLIRASPVDEVVARAVNDVTFMLAHPDTLADPAPLDRAMAANQQRPILTTPSRQPHEDHRRLRRQETRLHRNQHPSSLIHLYPHVTSRHQLT